MPRVTVELSEDVAQQRIAGETLAARWRRLGELSGVEVVLVGEGEGDHGTIQGLWLAWTAEDLAAYASGGTGGPTTVEDAPIHWAQREADEVEARRRALAGLGVRLVGGGPVLIGPRVGVSPGAVLGPHTVLLGATRIGAARIDHGAHLEDTLVEDGAHVRPYTVAEGAHVGEGVVVGPFAHLRAGTTLQAGSKVGNFVETKNTTLGPGAKANHLSYLGDCTVGEASNIGAGTITCNYDGARKHPTEIGRRAFVGTNSSLVAPVRIGDDTLVAAGSVVTQDVPDTDLAIARGRQRNVAGRGQQVLDANRAAKAAERGEDEG